MENNYNPYFRIQSYLTYLGNEEDIDVAFEIGSTITAMAEKTGIPLSVIRKDIASLMEYGQEIDIVPDYGCEEYLRLDAKYQLGDELVTGEAEKYQLKKILELIIAGEFDQVTLIYEPKSDNKYIVQFTPEEYNALLSFDKTSERAEYMLPFSVKDSFRFKKNLGFEKIFRKICNGIEKEKSLRLEYVSNSKKLHTLVIKPLKLVYDSIDNEYALITIHKHEVKAFKLACIRNVDVVDEIVVIPEKDLKLLEHIDQVWGFEFMDKPRHIKVKFYNIGNVWDKVKKDLSYRIQGKIYEKDGYLYYEDTVYGLYSFRSWIFGYGAAAIVEEPAELRESILESLDKRAQQE